MISVLAQTHTTIVRGQIYHPLKADDITHQGSTLWIQVTLGEDIIFNDNTMLAPSLSSCC